MINRVTCIELPVSDMGEAVAFYEDVLALKKTYQHPLWTSFDIAGTPLALAVSGTKGRGTGAEICKGCSPCVLRFSAGKMRPDPEAPSATSVVYLEVGNLDTAHAELCDRAVQFIAPPKAQGWGGRTAVMLDPDKNILVLTQSQ